MMRSSTFSVRTLSAAASLFAAALVSTSALGGSCSSHSSAATAGTHSHQDIVDIASSAGSFNTLVAAVKAAGLVDLVWPLVAQCRPGDRSPDTGWIDYRLVQYRAILLQPAVSPRDNVAHFHHASQELRGSLKRIGTPSISSIEQNYHQKQAKIDTGAPLKPCKTRFSHANHSAKSPVKEYRRAILPAIYFQIPV